VWPSFSRWLVLSQHFVVPYLDAETPARHALHVKEVKKDISDTCFTVAFLVTLLWGHLFSP
jgi:hypothetical protein